MTKLTRRAKFVEARASNGFFHGTRENKGLSQRDKLEESILNLASALGLTTVERGEAQSGTLYAYEGQPFQSASNTIVSLSREVLQRNARR